MILMNALTRIIMMVNIGLALSGVLKSNDIMRVLCRVIMRVIIKPIMMATMEIKIGK